MTEELLHFIWKFRLFRPFSLCTTANLPLKILHPGEHNLHAGPDFTNGRIVIDNTEWAGTIEIHRLASEWNRHGHHLDKAYNNVILHVVYQFDQEVYNAAGRAIPCLELKELIEPGLLEHYNALYKNKREIACGSQLGTVPAPGREAWLERMLIARLEEKTLFIKETFDHTKKDWEETFYWLLCKSFGFQVNAEPFLQMARHTPLRLVLKHANSPLQSEALLFGQSGLLDEEFTEEYPQLLKKEYSFLKQKYQLQSIPAATWKFLRMRPGNFPTLRLAQLAACLQNYQHLFSRIIEEPSLPEVRKLFAHRPSAYWDTHYSFHSKSPKKSKTLGEGSIENILINTVCPLLFFYGKEKGLEHLCEKAVDWLYAISPENNRITRLYEAIGFKPQNAGHSQALLQLHKRFCQPKKCLSCGIGTSLLQRPSEFKISSDR